MKIITLITLVLAACAANPHRVCSVATIVNKGSCESIGRNVGTEGADVALWRPAAGGTMWCRSTLDPKSPVVCSVILRSPAEQAAMMAPPPAPPAPAPVAAPAPPVVPLPNPPAAPIAQPAPMAKDPAKP